MAESFIADTQYNDLLGSVAMDGHGSPSMEKLEEICKVPSGYFAIGFSLFRLDPTEDGTIPITVAAVKQSEVGQSMGEIINYAAENEKLPVFQFDGEMTAEQFPAIFKRISIKVLDKNIDPQQVAVQDRTDIVDETPPKKQFAGEDFYDKPHSQTGLTMREMGFEDD